MWGFFFLLWKKQEYQQGDERHIKRILDYEIVMKCGFVLESVKGVQPFGISGPQWKKKSCLGPHIKYTNTNKN